MLIFITTGAYSAVSFVFFSDSFKLGLANTIDPNNPDNPYFCDTMLRCFFIVTSIGIRGKWEGSFEPTNTVGRLIFNFFFYIMVTIIETDIIESTILDSFEERRSVREEKEELRANKCFICNIDKQRFDTRANEGLNFDFHKNNDHFMWNYVYFIVSHPPFF
jgi:hypothetical protein